MSRREKISERLRPARGLGFAAVAVPRVRDSLILRLVVQGKPGRGRPHDACVR
ncbi:MAG TPA: hypothetical protein VHV47_05840 [Opitutaceae bacterium]|jgi:hypothetical protein|nr:hypothetical protein [Opitutaceae bacterium]